MIIRWGCERNGRNETWEDEVVRDVLWQWGFSCIALYSYAVSSLFEPVSHPSLYFSDLLPLPYDFLL